MTAQLTFLFTDIEASSQAWERNADDMSLALARHDEAIQQAVKAAGGRVFKHTGDGICAAFATASAALAAGLDAQQRLQGDDWEGQALRVRMAVHTGAAEQRGGDYFGPALNRTARLLDTAHGRQIVVSLVAAELARDDLPPGIDLLDLGEHRLADLTRPERIFQVAQADSPSSFPPLRSLGSHRHNLPVTPSSFIGRERELEAVTDILRRARLLTLSGVGGVGKTRLGLQVAAGLVEEYPDGVFLIDLARLADPALVVPKVVRVLQLVETRDTAGAALDRLCAFLQARRMLLLLDNCEHLVDPVANLCEALLQRCPEVVVLTTSREPLAVGGEVVWRVPTLRLATDAVTLFCERARAACADFTLTPDGAPAIERICRRLDGIPLALELAAARIQVLSPDQIADRLDDRFRFLSTGPRTASARQQTLRATMDWSYDLLEESEKLLLQRISVFPAGFDLEAAEAVAADGSSLERADVLDVLARLVDKSLVVVDGRGREARYRLLETVREYGAEKLAAADPDDGARLRHRDHFLQLTERVYWADPMGEVPWQVALRREGDNVIAALKWSLDRGDVESALRLVIPLGWFWTTSGRLAEGRAGLEGALARAGPDHELSRGRLLTCLGWLLSTQGEMERSLAHHEEALAITARLGEPIDSGMAGWFLAQSLLHRGDIERAERVITRAGQDFEAAGSLGGIGWYEYNLGWICFTRGEECRPHFDTALELGRRGQARTLLCHTLGTLATLSALTGEDEQAVALAEEGVECARRIGLFTMLVMALTRTAEVGILLGQWDRVRVALAESLTMLRDGDALAFVADSLEMAAMLREAAGAAASAARLLGAGHGVRLAAGETPDVRSISTELDRCRARVGKAVGDFEVEWRRGAQLSPREALAFAVAEIERPAADDVRFPRSAPAVTRATLRRSDHGWSAGFGESRFDLPDIKGVGYLARLVAEAGREVHVLDLIGGTGDGGTGPVLDDRAKQEYRRRIRDLRAELDEAESWNDSERAARAQAELDALSRQLAAAMGLGNRDRPSASSAERARVSVRKAVAKAIDLVAEHDPDFGRLLSTTVKTGTFCSYVPDPRIPVTWSL